MAYWTDGQTPVDTFSNEATTSSVGVGHVGKGAMASLMECIDLIEAAATQPPARPNTIETIGENNRRQYKIN